MLLTKFQNFVKNNALVSDTDKVLLAVSGGVDSMAMLSLFVDSGYDIGVAHCNFGLRGEESDEDEVLVESETKKYGVPFYNMRFDTQSEMERSGESTQMVARRLRYDWFAELCKDHGYTVIAIAHHADDSVETFFINLFRGTGLRGLTGIHRVNGRIIRPLLFATRKDILEYAHLKEVGFREDSSNRSTKYLRNKIRLGIIPRMKEINPHFTDLMSANVQRLTGAQIFISCSIEKIRSEVEVIENGIVKIDPQRIEAGFPKEFVIYELMNKYGFKGDVVSSLYKALGRNISGKKFYSADWVAWIDRGMIVISRIEEGDSCEIEVTKDTTRIFCGNAVLYFDYVDVDQIDTLNQPENVALLDCDKITFPLKIRKWNNGDSFIPIGMHGTKKVSDYLIDSKVSMADKSRQFVITSADDIIWLVGRRIDDRYKIVNATELVLKITREVL